MGGLEIGQEWYVQFGKGCTLVAVEIRDVTEKTVLLKKLADRSVHLCSRYVTDEIKFVERITS